MSKRLFSDKDIQTLQGTPYVKIVSTKVWGRYVAKDKYGVCPPFLLSTNAVGVRHFHFSRGVGFSQSLTPAILIKSPKYTLKVRQLIVITMLLQFSRV
ncbi:hypothetical protein GCM10010954_28770 [Halobacillus andaensis]|uniref:Uncharacterized protein n=1 Tax=Halobacillus andaensis TaxID=1176239 RepID=A0A917EZ80_HALAA|nr:hypothetical protein [Halobacillus andaensis]GGF27896.1 hypothetical protein GCM10010954_28770 [Halobacillus andaensis]